MNTILLIILSACIISLASFSGALLAFKKINSWFSQNTKLLVTFAAGIFLMTSIGLLSETFEFLTREKAIFSVLAGFLGMLLLHKILPETHHHHDNECPTCIPQKSSTKVIVGDIIHNVADGIVLVVGFSISKEVGILALTSVLVHEFIQEISEYIVLRNSGYSNKKALTINFLSSLSIFIGVLIGFLLTQDPGFQAILLGISAGAFLHIVFHDLIPFSIIKKIPKNNILHHFVVFFLAIGIMVVIGFTLPHAHEHGDEHTHENMENHIDEIEHTHHHHD